MGEVSVIGLDLAKHVFQVHGADAFGQVVIRKQLRRAQVLEFFGCGSAWNKWPVAFLVQLITPRASALPSGDR